MWSCERRMLRFEREVFFFGVGILSSHFVKGWHHYQFG